jgi:hypothetical protein
MARLVAASAAVSARIRDARSFARINIAPNLIVSLSLSSGNYAVPSRCYVTIVPYIPR